MMRICYGDVGGDWDEGDDDVDDGGGDGSSAMKLRLHGRCDDPGRAVQEVAVTCGVELDCVSPLTSSSPPIPLPSHLLSTL